MTNWKVAKIVFLIVALTLVQGCGKPTVDTSTDAKMQSSIASVKKSLPESEQAAFEDAIKTLMLADVNDLSDIVALGADKTGKFERIAKERLNGKTADEIIAAAKQVDADKEQRRLRVEAERKEKERQAVIKEIEELRSKLGSERLDILGKFAVERSRFGMTDGFIPQAAFELSVRNNTGKAVSRAYFRAMLVTPGRTLPWVDDEFNYSIPGGLEPNETAEWKLTPNMFGGWSKAPTDRNDTVFIVKPIRLDGSDGKSFTGEPIDESALNRLNSLLETVQYEKAAEIKAALEARDKATADWRTAAVPLAVWFEAEQLRTRKADADRANSSLAKFVIQRSQFAWADTGFSRAPLIDLTVRNETGKAVSNFHAHGILSSPGRETAWVDEDFSYAMTGGIQPGESKQFKLGPNQFGAWGNAPKDRTDLVLTVTVKQLDGADGKELFPSNFKEADAKRLQVLEKMIADNKW